MQNPRNHHFIPAFYLKRWTGTGGTLVEWSKPHKKIVPMRRHPNGTGFQRDLYTFPELRPGFQQWFEEKFLKFNDDVASDALTHILAGRMTDLNASQRSGWARFLMTVRLRHPDCVAELRNSNAELCKNHDVLTRDGYEKMRSSNDPPTFGEYLSNQGPDANSRMEIELLIAAMDNKTLGERILRMDWRSIDLIKSSRHLLTSDWPVALESDIFTMTHF